MLGIGVLLMAALYTAPAVHVSVAQEMTYLGTVVAVEAARLQIKIVDAATKQEAAIWFVIDKDTRVKRGDEIVSSPVANIAVGERIAVLVDPASRTKMLATEIRLAAPVVAKPAMPAAGAAAASPAAAAPHVHTPGMAMPAADSGQTAAGWQLMQDGVVNVLVNHQGGPRGGDEVVVPNWWMGMLTRQKGRHQFGLNGMFSLDPATVGKSGYGEIFQVGEALDGKPLIDRQHPHDFFMQLAASWRLTLGEGTSLMFSGGPAGEPTLGPVAFMHRASAAGLAMAPLGHHTFDSTHIAFGVLAAAIERGRWTFEASVFNGREPDEHRWDFDFGAMDSAAGRVWFTPAAEWELQVSTGRLREPEELVAGDATRTTASASWLRQSGTDMKAATFGYGFNSAHAERRHGAFGEFTVTRSGNEFFGRLEAQQVETAVLLTGEIPHHAEDTIPAETVTGLTLGAARRLFTWRGFEGALSAQATVYAVPELLKPSHGSRPLSAQVMFRLRLPTGPMGRMWNMRMSRGHKMEMDHSGHVMR